MTIHLATLHIPRRHLRKRKSRTIIGISTKDKELDLPSLYWTPTSVLANSVVILGPPNTPRNPYPMRRSRITIIFYCRYWSVPIKLALEKPLTNCDTFPDNNDPNDLSVLWHQVCFFWIYLFNGNAMKPHCHFCLLADDKFDYLPILQTEKLISQRIWGKIRKNKILSISPALPIKLQD